MRPLVRRPIEWAVLPLKRYAAFRGRAPRAEYWWFCLLVAGGQLIFGQLDRLADIGAACSIVFGLAMALPWLAVTVRRLHDTARSGWWLLSFVLAWIAVTLIGIVLGSMDEPSESVEFTAGMAILLIVLGTVASLLALMVLPGTRMANRFGPDPYGPDQLEDVFA